MAAPEQPSLPVIEEETETDPSVVTPDETKKPTSLSCTSIAKACVSRINAFYLHKSDTAENILLGIENDKKLKPLNGKNPFLDLDTLTAQLGCWMINQVRCCSTDEVTADLANFIRALETAHKYGESALKIARLST